MPQVRFVVGACGSKFGKTFGTSIAIVKNAWNKENSLNWWVAPTYVQSQNAMKIVKSMLPEGIHREYRGDFKIAILNPNGSERSMIEFKSADNPDNLRGFGVNFFVMDEAARCPYDSYVSLMTTVTQTLGKGFFISTPFGRGFFYDIYQKGVKEDDDGNPLYTPETDPNPAWYSVRLPTWTNPFVPMESILEAKRTLSEDMFRQEYAAQFLLESAGVFRNIQNCVKGEFSEPLSGHNYVMGVDLARLKDFSVITVMDKDLRHVVYFDRFNQISWEVQYSKIIQTAKKYRATVCVDSTGLGDPIVETLQRAGIRVSPYKIHSSTAKTQLIDKLRVALEKEQISFPRIPVLIHELETYEQEVTSSGTVKFSAPHGKFDDCVISLALCYWIADTPPWVYRYYSHRCV